MAPITGRSALHMRSLLQVRTMLPADLPFADSLRALVGWNQTLADWQRFLRMEPQGCFLAEWDGAPAGTATTVVYGSDLAWIGMVLVHPEYRRRGIGGGLLLRCIRHLRARGVRCIKLDATPQGRPVYEKLGFRDEWTLRRWEADLSFQAPRAPDSRIQAWTEVGAPQFDLLDSSAFGVSRRELMMALAQQSSCALTYESQPGTPAGCGMLRQGARALYLGPISAASAEAGIALIEALMGQGCAGRVFWDIPDANAAAVGWAEQHGFSVQRTLTRMWLGDNLWPGNPREQFALAGPELG
jgi:ribosomal protein S18 acetylase RimI-like enzyme